MKFFLRETESWSAVNKSKLHKTEKVSVIIEPSDNRYNSDLVCMVLGNSKQLASNVSKINSGKKPRPLRDRYEGHEGRKGLRRLN